MSIAFAPLLLAAVPSVAFTQAVTAQVGATVIAPASVMRSWADWPVTVSLSGGWVRLALPPAGAPLLVSGLSAPHDPADSIVAVSPVDSTTLLRPGTAAELRGKFATSLSSPAPLSAGSYRVTVAFN